MNRWMTVVLVACGAAALTGCSQIEKRMELKDGVKQAKAVILEAGSNVLAGTSLAQAEESGGNVVMYLRAASPTIGTVFTRYVYGRPKKPWSIGVKGYGGSYTIEAYGKDPQAPPLYTEKVKITIRRDTATAPVL